MCKWRYHTALIQFIVSLRRCNKNLITCESSAKNENQNIQRGGLDMTLDLYLQSKCWFLAFRENVAILIFLLST